jgi:arginyl-tRNA synthetase
VAGPGFLNFSLNRVYFKTTLEAAIVAGEQWGRNETEANQVVLLEYTSPNLFKPLHVGNLVGNIIGESLTRLFEMSGANVKRLNYPSDIGLTVAKGVWGLRETGGDPSDIKALGEAYRFGNEAYEKDSEEKEQIIAVNQALYAESDPDLNLLRDQGIFTSKYRLNTICASLGTFFDAEIFESTAAPVGIQIVKENIPAVFVESDGAVVYEGEKVGLHTRVFLNSKGLPTYEAKDLGNFVIKQERFPDWTRSIIVTGNEQTEYFKVLYASIKELYPDVEENKKTLEHIPTGFLTLTTGKMSSRKGNILSGEQVLEELEVEAKKRAVETEEKKQGEVSLATKVATAAIKYQILRHGVGSNIIFDKEKALSFEGDSGPYLQYTFARIQSVLAKAGGAGVVPSTLTAPTDAYAVEKMIEQFPSVIQLALEERAPHKVVTYLTELASEFNSFYAAEKIADPDDEFAPYKAAVAATVGNTLKQGLWALGIEAPDRM